MATHARATWPEVPEVEPAFASAASVPAAASGSPSAFPEPGAAPGASVDREGPVPVRATPVSARASSAGAQLTLPPARPRTGQMSILLMGIDQRPDEAANGTSPGRTDTMLLVSLDFDARRAALVSIPRDGWVTIPGVGGQRVNAAYTFGELKKRGGGPALAKKTIANLFGVRIDRYALVSIEGLERLIDELGGVWVDNPTRLYDPAYPTDDYGYKVVDIPAGRQLLDGQTAVEFARTRHPDSDYGRQSRQQQLLLALRDRLLQVEALPRLPQLLPTLFSLVQTDLSPFEIMQLAHFAHGLRPERDITTLQPDPQLTPPYTASSGAALVELTPAYRAAARRVLASPHLATEHAEVAAGTAGELAGVGG